MFNDDAEYDAFTEKFKPKKTTDDCYTPPVVYDAIRDWACREYGIDPERIVRPFYPDSDYEAFDYPDDCVVLDNPPFSILSQIVSFYLGRGIAFFLFCPGLTAFAGKKTIMKCNHIVPECEIEYENGAKIATAFITSFGGDIVAQTAPELHNAVERAVRQYRREKVTELPKYSYPDNVLTAAMLQRYSKYGVEFKVRRTDCVPISALDEQRPLGKSIYGGGLLLSERAAAERAAAKRFNLSEREKAMVEMLGEK